ncbi:hypothetical protein BLNAU_10826 [Blattamonas nauphoetae]|uniref:Transmembrane protein n=1 Tax=Blattamonas nauphoetae TaxID=2049346 RepID=A0ABQ9XP26_9EUKA|nr:hypothetical protein BLNAU_10826 [Blattamonas nauphoetae]
MLDNTVVTSSSTTTLYEPLHTHMLQEDESFNVNSSSYSNFVLANPLDGTVFAIAVLHQDASFSLTRTSFTNCAAPLGRGGAVSLFLAPSPFTQYSFTGNSFTNCTAVLGQNVFVSGPKLFQSIVAAKWKGSWNEHEEESFVGFDTYLVRSYTLLDMFSPPTHSFVLSPSKGFDFVGCGAASAEAVPCQTMNGVAELFPTHSLDFILSEPTELEEIEVYVEAWTIRGCPDHDQPLPPITLIQKKGTSIKIVNEGVAPTLSLLDLSIVLSSDDTPLVKAEQGGSVLIERCGVTCEKETKDESWLKLSNDVSLTLNSVTCSGFTVNDGPFLKTVLGQTETPTEQRLVGCSIKDVSLWKPLLSAPFRSPSVSMCNFTRIFCEECPIVSMHDDDEDLLSRFLQIRDTSFVECTSTDSQFGLVYVRVAAACKVELMRVSFVSCSNLGVEQTTIGTVFIHIPSADGAGLSESEAYIKQLTFRDCSADIAPHIFIDSTVLPDPPSFRLLVDFEGEGNSLLGDPDNIKSFVELSSLVSFSSSVVCVGTSSSSDDSADVFGCGTEADPCASLNRALTLLSGRAERVIWAGLAGEIQVGCVLTDVQIKSELFGTSRTQFELAESTLVTSDTFAVQTSGECILLALCFLQHMIVSSLRTLLRHSDGVLLVEQSTVLDKSDSGISFTFAEVLSGTVVFVGCSFSETLFRRDIFDIVSPDHFSLTNLTLSHCSMDRSVLKVSDNTNPHTLSLANCSFVNLRPATQSFPLFDFISCSVTMTNVTFNDVSLNSGVTNEEDEITPQSASLRNNYSSNENTFCTWSSASIVVVSSNITIQSSSFSSLSLGIFFTLNSSLFIFNSSLISNGPDVSDFPTARWNGICTNSSIFLSEDTVRAMAQDVGEEESEEDESDESEESEEEKNDKYVEFLRRIPFWFDNHRNCNISVPTGSENTTITTTLFVPRPERAETGFGIVRVVGANLFPCGLTVELYPKTNVMPDGSLGPDTPTGLIHTLPVVLHQSSSSIDCSLPFDLSEKSSVSWFVRLCYNPLDPTYSDEIQLTTHDIPRKAKDMIPVVVVLIVVLAVVVVVAFITIVILICICRRKPSKSPLPPDDVHTDHAALTHASPKLGDRRSPYPSDIPSSPIFRLYRATTFSSPTKWTPFEDKVCLDQTQNQVTRSFSVPNVTTPALSHSGCRVADSQKRTLGRSKSMDWLDVVFDDDSELEFISHADTALCVPYFDQNHLLLRDTRF